MTTLLPPLTENHQRLESSSRRWWFVFMEPILLIGECFGESILTKGVSIYEAGGC